MYCPWGLRWWSLQKDPWQGTYVWVRGDAERRDSVLIGSQCEPLASSLSLAVSSVDAAPPPRRTGGMDRTGPTCTLGFRVSMCCPQTWPHDCEHSHICQMVRESLARVGAVRAPVTRGSAPESGSASLPRASSVSGGPALRCGWPPPRRVAPCSIVTRSWSRCVPLSHRSARQGAASRPSL